jgi:Mg-chelatase subunit ChlD
MSFLTALALLTSLFVAAPVAAHLLRRRRAGEQLFPGAALLRATPPRARRRSALEDRALFGVRALAVLALALLGATPFISCARLELLRKDGASVAMVLVVDDSLSMRARHTGSTESRFERARTAARELAQAMQPGDATALVLAGDPPRVVLAATTDRGAVSSALDALEPSDRATDLDGALRVASELLEGLPHRDRRVVLLSDLADGAEGAPALELRGALELWAPVPELAAASEADCAVIHAELREGRVDVLTACSPGTEHGGRRLVLREGETMLAEAPASSRPGLSSLRLSKPITSTAELWLELEGDDAIDENDSAPVVESGTEPAIAIVSDAAASRVETGGAPVVEQALAALMLGERLRPLASLPDHAEELTPYAGIVFDDPPGFTPEERRALASWLEKGGTALLGLGRRAASAPLGAGFEGILPGVVRRAATEYRGVVPERCAYLGPSAAGLADLGLEHRSTLEHTALEGADVLCAFADGEPLLVRRHLGRGTLFVVTLPFDVEESDLPLRPAFLALLERFAETARTGGGARRVDVGQSFAFPGHAKVEASFLPRRGAPIPMVSTERDGILRVAAPRAGSYRVRTSDGEELRVASVSARELDLRPRALAPSARNPELGGASTRIDASPYVAMLLLGLMALESALRLVASRSSTGDAPRH